MIEKVSRLWIDRKLRAYQLAVDLGRRTADERIARLILGLQERLVSLGTAEGQDNRSSRCANIMWRTPPASLPSMSARCCPSFVGAD